MRCPAENRIADSGVKPVSVHRIDLPGHFNPSIIDWRGRTILSSRRMKSIYLTELDERWNPMQTVTLRIVHDKATISAEDARLYSQDGELCLSFTGVHLKAGHIQTTVLRAAVDDSLQVVRVWEPQYGRRTWPKEKNWMPFGDDLTVYSVSPHRVLHGRETLADLHEVPWRPKWSGGLLRGGCPPVRVGDEWWHFFHGVTEPGSRTADYTLGLYAFSAEATYTPLRMIPHPILRDRSTDRPRDENPAVYPCGAIRRGDVWHISYGLHNRHAELATFRHDDLESALEPV